MTAQTTRFKTCFISTTLDTDTSKLRQALEQHGVKWTDAAAALSAGASLTQSVYKTIQEADFVCVVIDSDYQSTFVPFEMGVAVGVQKPLLIFVAPDVNLPSDFEGFATVRTDLQNSEPINFALDIFLAHAQSNIGQVSIPERQTSTSINMQWAWDNVAAMRQSASDPASSNKYLLITDTLISLFQAAGALVADSPDPDLKGADMAVWFDALQDSLGNPILIECKIGEITQSRLAEAEYQLRGLLAKTQAKAGIVIYSDRDGRQFPATSKTLPLIYRFSIEEFIEAVGSGDFASILLTQRNQLLHGRSLAHAAR